MYKVFIDGQAGTTGLRIGERLGKREDISLITLPEALRKDPEARKQAMGEAHAAILCLPDDAAREAAAWAPPGVAVID
ncbi:MAG: N-acetyl-gamma-glutamyl-phosphate reductase, partial [Oscillospiraceae bacterium]|nr:N-acetyl-gamma-glutamyl-phosphate reductase [Oscillospiraceae bacterium]